uniref:Hexosyltransferase n=1 Tax=Biomphalaria glabrata TaxID=6526 RepID=A0A2C9LCE1_BIOGL
MVCSKAPVVSRTQCSGCFRPSVSEWSRKLVQFTDQDRVHPRGPEKYFQTRREMQQELVDGILIAPWSVCTESCPYLVAIQLSTIEMSDERMRTRTTWASVAKTSFWPHRRMNADLKIVFVVAHKIPDVTVKLRGREATLPSEKQWRQLTTESDLHGDILYLDMIDSYPNLTLKVTSSLKWLSEHCLRTKYFLKVDTDTFVNVPLLLDLLILNEEALSYSVLGYIINGSRTVAREGRWAVDRNIYPMAMYPFYAAGCAYVISAQVARAIVAVSPYIPMLPIEDAYVTGVMTKVVKAQLFAHNELFTEFMDHLWQRCQMVLDTKIASTNSGGDQAIEIWSAILVQNKTCFTANTVSEEDLINIIYSG